MVTQAEREAQSEARVQEFQKLLDIQYDLHNAVEETSAAFEQANKKCNRARSENGVNATLAAANIARRNYNNAVEKYDHFKLEHPEMHY